MEKKWYRPLSYHANYPNRTPMENGEDYVDSSEGFVIRYDYLTSPLMHSAYLAANAGARHFYSAMGQVSPKLYHSSSSENVLYSFKKDETSPDYVHEDVDEEVEDSDYEIMSFVL
jgi:hypothetical protein